MKYLKLLPFCLGSYILFFFTVQTRAQSIEEKLLKAEEKLHAITLEEQKQREEIEQLKFDYIRIMLDSIGLPEPKTGDEVIYHSAMTLVFNDAHKHADWVAHIILPDIATGNEGRSNDFRPDPKVKNGTAVDADYFIRKKNANDKKYSYDGFGYDRGHLAPSADFRYSKTALSESYYYSNISPQVAALNRGRWSDMEDALRKYVIRNDVPVYVVTGGILHTQLQKIEKGVNKVSIPEYFFKVAIDVKNQKSIAFIMPNKACEKHLMHYVVSIDSVEKISGINFFYKLPDSLQQALEEKSNVYAWLAEQEDGNVLPLDASSLPPNTFNTLQAKIYEGKNETITVCGTVVSTKLSAKGHTFINLDKQFPNPVFTISVFEKDAVNFSYQPHLWLMNKLVCVKGRVTNANGNPGMILTNEKQITVLED